MNRDRLYLGFVTALIVTVVIYTSYGLLNSEKKDTHYVVSVIVSNSGSDRWNAFKEGLNQGADEGLDEIGLENDRYIRLPYQKVTRENVSDFQK